MTNTAKKTSEIIKDIIASSAVGGQITVGEFMQFLGERAFCLVILMFSLPNSLPVPGIPGFSTLTGLPITFIAFQMVMGRETIWLPYRIASKHFSRQGLAKILAKALPAVIWLEKYLTPRWLFVTSRAGERMLGLLFIALSLLIALPIPGGNFLPGLSMSLIALGMLERDGIFLTGAVCFAVASMMFMYEIVILFFKAIAKAFTAAF